jgi:hypothetical protein
VSRGGLVVIQDLLLGDEVVGNHGEIVRGRQDRHMTQIHLHDPPHLAGQAHPVPHPHQLAEHDTGKEPLQGVLQRKADDGRRGGRNGHQRDHVDAYDRPEEDYAGDRQPGEQDQHAQQVRDVESFVDDEVVFQEENIHRLQE